MDCGRLGIFLLACASCAFAQVDASTLRAKFGTPVSREVFTVRPGIEMIVDYSLTGNHACRLELPGLAPMPADAPTGVGINTKKPIDDLLVEIVPLSMRGKEGASFCMSTGINARCSTDYENLSILESLNAGRRTAVIVKFKIAGCTSQ
jgi:hypothetical protein